MGTFIVLSTLALLGVLTVAALRHEGRSEKLGLKWAFDEPTHGREDPHDLTRVAGDLDLGRQQVNVFIDKATTRNQWSLSTRVNAPLGCSVDLTDMSPERRDPRFHTDALDDAKKRLDKLPLLIDRLSVGDGALHLHGNSTVYDSSQKQKLESEITSVAQALARAARALDEIFARGGFETRTCPRCRDVALDLCSGSLGEDRCPQCRIHFLDAERTQRLCDELHVNPLELKSTIAVGRSEVVCAVCQTPMAPVLIEHTIVDLCRGCSAMLLDDGELAELRPHA